jgi:hypothetical protein
MNAGRKGEDSSRSGLARNKLFGAFGHVHNPFSVNSRRGHDADDFRQDGTIGNLRTMSLLVEITRAEAILTAQNLVARIQKS